MVSLLCTGFRPATCALGGACHMIPALLLPELAATAAKKSSSSSFILIILVIGVAAYFLLIRPNQQKAKKAKAAGSSIAEGDQVVTIGGIVGRCSPWRATRSPSSPARPTTAGSPTCSHPARDAAARRSPQGRADRACRRGRRPRVRRPRRHDGHDGREHDETTGTGRTTTATRSSTAGPTRRAPPAPPTRPTSGKRTAPRPARKNRASECGVVAQRSPTQRSLIISVVAVVVITFGSLLGVLLANWSPRLGLDLAGGLEVVYAPPARLALGAERDGRHPLQPGERSRGLGRAGLDQGQQIVVQVPGITDGQQVLKSIARPPSCSSGPSTATPALRRPQGLDHHCAQTLPSNCPSGYQLVTSNLTGSTSSSTG